MDLYLHLKKISLMLLLLGLWASCAHAQPWTPQVIWQRNGAGDSSRYGAYIDRLGDQNGDGFADFAMDALGWGPQGQASAARYELFHGGNPPDSIPYRRFPEDTTGLRRFGVGLTIGDVNGDHHIDWMTTSIYRATPTYVTYSVYRGGPNADSLPWAMLQVLFSQSIVPCGDFNGDGYDDLYRYDWDADYGQVLFGGPTLDTIPDWTNHSPSDFPQQALLRSFGDLNGDGYGDFIADSYASQQTWFYVFWGGQNPDTVPGVSLPVGTNWIYSAVVNDLNGDHRAELITVASTDYEVRWGGDTISLQPSVVLNFGCQLPGGGDMTGVGDINGDGWGDLVMSEEYCSDDYFGTASLYLGCPWMSSAPAYVFWGFDPPANIIGHKTAAGLGDVNGDGIADFALGGFNDTNQGMRGRAVVIAGDANLHAATDDLPAALPSDLRVSVYPNPFNAVASISYAVPKAGEVSVKVFDLTGRLVKTLCEGRREAGEQAVGFEGKGLSSGVYLVRVQVGDAVARAVKVMLLK